MKLQILILMLIVFEITSYIMHEYNMKPLETVVHTQTFIFVLSDLPSHCWFSHAGRSFRLQGCQNYRIGDVLEITGTLVASSDSQGRQEKSIDIQSVTQKTSGFSLGEVITSRIAVHSAQIKQRILGVFLAYLPSDSANLAFLTVFGGSLSVLTQESKQSIISSGLAHIVAASGMNVAFVLYLVQPVKHTRRSLVFLLSFLVVLSYTALASFSVPVVRAALSLVIARFCQLICLRSVKPGLVLSVTAFLQLLLFPWLITSVSFILSYAASIGLLLGIESIARSSSIINLYSTAIDAEGIRNNWKTQLLDYCKATLVLTFTCWIWVSPILAYFFGTVGLTTFISALLTTWLVPILFAISSGFAVYCLIFGSFASLGLLTALFSLPILWGTRLMLEAAQLSASFDALLWQWQPSQLQMVLWYACLLSVLVVRRWRGARRVSLNSALSAARMSKHRREQHNSQTVSEILHSGIVLST